MTRNLIQGTERDWYGIVMMGIVLALTGGFIGTMLGHFVWTEPGASVTDLRSEYYRGVYDTCVDFIQEVYSFPDDTAREFCLETVPKIAATGWYEKVSKGYVVPPKPSVIPTP